MIIIALVVSLIPSLAVFFWLRNRAIAAPEHKRLCTRAFGFGLLTVLPVVVLSGALSLLGWALPIDGKSLFGAAYHAFVVLALAEELAKLFMYKRVVKGVERQLSRLTTVIAMTVVGLGFGLLEDVVYGFTTNAGQMLVRGVTMGHMGYGFIMGLFIAKAVTSGKRCWYMPAVLVPWVLHGLYDFTLSPQAEALGDLAVFVPVTLAALDVVLVVCAIVYVVKKRRDPAYTAPIEPVSAE